MNSERWGKTQHLQLRMTHPGSFDSNRLCPVLLHLVTSTGTELLAMAFAMHMDNMHLYKRIVTPGWTWQWWILLCMWNLAARGKTRGSNFLHKPAWWHRQSLFRLLRDVYACVILCCWNFWRNRVTDRTVGACHIRGGQRLLVRSWGLSILYKKECIQKTWLVLQLRAGD